ncbi:MAG: type I-E CRISPR-associated protein Cse2/CasB [Deltaproteobacteria bacterium]|nr:type I-E CRISPR-associated protein Cse2/CasB [Deltaproteobacteria bacterium]
MTMQASSAKPASHADVLVDDIRVVRARYDQLDRGLVAQLRRCRSATEVELEGTYWRIAGDFGRRQPNLVRHLAHVVLLFPYAAHRTRQGFSVGRFLREQLDDKDGSSLRVRRILAVETRDELDHRLRALLRLTAAGGAPVDWGVVGRDLLWFFAESDATRRRWAQDFYAPSTFDPSTDSRSAT